MDFVIFSCWYIDLFILDPLIIYVTVPLYEWSQAQFGHLDFENEIECKKMGCARESKSYSCLVRVGLTKLDDCLEQAGAELCQARCRLSLLLVS